MAGDDAGLEGARIDAGVAAVDARPGPAAGTAAVPADASGPLMSVGELAALLASGGDPTVLDVRWTLGATDPHGAYLAGHLPGAVYVDLDTELADPPSPQRGRHPLPAPERLQRAVRRWGLRPGRPVVVCDAAGGTSAARAWWLLRDAGVAEVRVLDGGLDAWRAAGLPIEPGEVVPAPGTLRIAPGHLPRLDADAAGALPASGVLLDARAGERYRGEVEPVDPRAGHIPGAISAPTTENLGADGRFRAPEALRARFAALGVDGRRPVGVSCGSGVTASHTVLALAVIGVEAALYPGSWSQWSASGRPVATGRRP